MIADDALLIEHRREALVAEMRQQEEPRKEAPNPLRMTELERFQYWQELDAAQESGGTLNEKELRLNFLLMLKMLLAFQTKDE